MHTKLLLTFCMFSVTAFAQNQDILTSRYPLQELKQILVPGKDYKPFPSIRDRVSWSHVPEKLKLSYFREAESFLTFQWPSLPATTVLMFVRNGNRSEFEAKYFQKRKVLGTLLIAEVLENKGRFLDQIINGIWSICEESSWVIPAHYRHSPAIDALPDVSNPFVDLFSAETGNYLAWTYYFLHEKLDSVSPQITRRIAMEIDTRILTPNLTQTPFWSKVSMNWNTWICSNWLNTILLMEKKEDRRLQSVEKVLQSLDNFLNSYPRDGGCDEGPGYWDAAGAALFESFQLLSEATGGKFSPGDFPFIKNIATFIYKAQINKDYFINFADAEAKPGISGNMVYLIGKQLNDKALMEFGAYYNDDTIPNVMFHFTRNLYALFNQDEINSTVKKLPLLREVWLPDIQVMVSREKEGTDDGFCIAALAGNNGESHNHNDVGSFIVYYSGQPVFIDPGPATYTARVFSKDRYSLWMYSSDFHNCPSINGKGQSDGIDFKATNVVFKNDKSISQLSCDIAKAYAAEVGVKSFKRSITLNRTRNVVISDKYTLTEAGEVAENLMTIYKPDLTMAGVIKLQLKSGPCISILYNSKLLNATAEKILFSLPEDNAVKKEWGDDVYRIRLKTIDKKRSNEWKLEIKK